MMINNLRPKKRLVWMIKDLDYVKRYYHYSETKTRILTKEQIIFIRSKFEIELSWFRHLEVNLDQMVEVTLGEPDDFLKVRET